MAPNYRQIMAIRKANEDKIRKMCPDVTDNPGIYLFWRVDSDGFRFCYVGQARTLCKRMAEHLSGYQHIDLSIKKHKFYDEESNPWGYHAEVIEECSLEDLDAREYDISAGGGVVGVKINGKKEILSIDIQPEIVDPDDIETLSDILVAAVNEAIKRVDDTNNAEMSKITGSAGLSGIPGLF